MKFNHKEIGIDRFEIEDIEALDEKQLLDYQIAVMQWYKDGGEVEMQYQKDRQRTKSPRWDWIACKYFPVPKPSYEERQAKWIEENNVKVGGKVKCLPFTDRQDGFELICHYSKDAFGEIAKIAEIHCSNIIVSTGDIEFYSFPYFALELIKPQYKPYEKADPAWLVKADEVLKWKELDRFTEVAEIDKNDKQRAVRVYNNWYNLEYMFSYYEWYDLATGETRPFGEQI